MLLQGYGMTESCGMCAIMPPEFFRYDTVGLPVPSIGLKVCLRPPLLLSSFAPGPAERDRVFVGGSDLPFLEGGTDVVRRRLRRDREPFVLRPASTRSSFPSFLMPCLVSSLLHSCQCANFYLSCTVPRRSRGGLFQLRTAGGDGGVWEVYIRGPSVISGYYERPDLNEDPAIFAGDGWMRTGDVGQWNKDGTLTLIDRSATWQAISAAEEDDLESSDTIDNVKVKIQD
ncbi:hypothetical protein B0H19DRAFT_1325315 [Mycena capillaripes]|nr:hypothetical protein B0H19DRAFT_1325315 [Mycena capillaripes]